MAVSDRRPAVWPWLIMPLIVLAVFYALHRVQHPPTGSLASPAASAGASGSTQQ